MFIDNMNILNNAVSVIEQKQYNYYDTANNSICVFKNNIESKFSYILNNYNKTDFKYNIKIDYINKDFEYKLLNNIIHKKTILVGIFGESGVGKSQLINEIKTTSEKYNLPISFLSTDNYFKDISKEIKKAGSFSKLVLEHGFDSDSPQAMQIDLLKNHLQLLSNGTNIKSPMYIMTFNKFYDSGASIPDSILVEAKKIVFVEGTALSFENVSNLLDIKIYADVDASILKSRYYGRASSRGYSGKKLDEMWEYVNKKADIFIRPFKYISDIIFNTDYKIGSVSNLIEDIIQ